jgi:hypothetical protein
MLIGGVRVRLDKCSCRPTTTRLSGIRTTSVPIARSFRSDGVELSALSPQLRRIAIEVRGNTSPVGSRGRDHVKANPKSIRIRCAYCYASAWRRRHRAGQYCACGGLSCCAELNRPAGEALVLPIGLGNSEKVLVLACTQPTGATSRCAGYIGAGLIFAIDATSVRASTCG